ncbi:MAG: hypothetical protein QXJ73_07195 [Candidatus Caldarchaeum sp.]
MNRVKKIAGASSFAALAYVMGLAPASIPFPLLPFLRFDLAEIPDLLSFIIFGWKYGLMTAFAHWYGLLVTAQGVFAPPPVPQLMKLTAVLATFLGVYLGTRISKRFGKAQTASATAMAVLTRAGVMAPITFAVYYLLFPTIYLPFGKRVLSTAGYVVDSDLAVATLITGFTAAFNALAALYLVPLCFSIAKALKRALGHRLVLAEAV